MTETLPPWLETPPEPNLWRTVSVHGQPPANTLVDYVPPVINDSAGIFGTLTGPEPKFLPSTQWRLSDLPPLNAVQPAHDGVHVGGEDLAAAVANTLANSAAPERPEPKFKVGDRVTHRNFAEPQEIRSCVWDGVKWTHEFVGRDGWWHEANLTAAPEPSIPIGGWFDPGDGRTLQRVDAASKETWASAFVFSDAAYADFVFFPIEDCSPLTEREAMERLAPAGTWLHDGDEFDGGDVEIIEWRDHDKEPVRMRYDDGSEGWHSMTLVRHSVKGMFGSRVLPGPPLPAPWRPLDELPEDGKRRVMAVRTDGLRETVSSSYVRRFPLAFAAWADLDDVAPIPAHLRGGA